MSLTTIIPTEVTWQPAFEVAYIVAASGVLAALAISAIARTFRAGPVRSLVFLAMRLLVIVAIALLLMGPSRVPEVPTDTAPCTLTVLLDTSGSMLTEDAEGRSRLAYVIDRWLGPDHLAKLNRAFNVRLIGFDETSRLLTAESLRQPPERLVSGRATRYSDVLREYLLQTPIGGIGDQLLVIGDGHDTDETPLHAAITVAKGRGVAVHTVAVGTSEAPLDVALTAVPRQEYLLAGEPGQIVVNLYQVGADPAATTLRVKGEGIDEQFPVRFGGRASATVEVPVKRDEPGVYEYTLSADPLEGEEVAANNSQTVFIEVTARRIRVLLLEGEPFWDTKFLAQALRGDAHVELSVLAKVTELKTPEPIVTRGEDRVVGVPTTAQDWANYDVVVLGRGIEKLLTPESAVLLAEYVASGKGHVVFARGRAYDPDTPAGRDVQRRLAVLEPVVWGSGLESPPSQARFVLTPEGRSHPSFAYPGGEETLDALPPLEVLPRVQSLKPAASRLASIGVGVASDANNLPAVVTMTYGSGRVFTVLGEGLWRWRLLPPRLARLHGTFDAFWSNTIRWIAMGGEFQPGQDVAMKLARSSLRLGDPMMVDVSLKFEPPAVFSPTLRMIGPTGEPRIVVLKPLPGLTTRYTGTFTPEQTGTWAAVLDAPPLSPARQARRFSVYDMNVERLRTAARPNVLRDLAEQTGGEFYTADQGIDLADRIERQRRANLVPPRPQFIWDKGWVMAALLAWMGIEWIARRRSGWL